MATQTRSEVEATDDLEKLKELVNLSKRLPGKFDWKKNLNEWQILFVDYILSVAKAVDPFVPTPKQAAKISEIVGRMTLI